MPSANIAAAQAQTLQELQHTAERELASLQSLRGQTGLLAASGDFEAKALMAASQVYGLFLDSTRIVEKADKADKAPHTASPDSIQRLIVAFGGHQVVITAAAGLIVAAKIQLA
ncbi:hypothetical protein HK105_206920 [Polyrhizophydium stewartii]|uniref:Uncharacterized protein n=1 Tax=Polyrhizophydium stewartii TaxID=2732419 RepID=A0ABR4N270_9FUNG